ncbi:Scy1p RNJ42_01636 [Nakaseomyces bracarensis]|uniref:Scy1p n=1 Tax=Nakaseomyces bracarensis TaxID=273131 RepID=UPI00387154FB
MMFWSSKSGISSKYTFSSSPTFTAEPWSVYTGRAKSGSSGKVSVFIFDKKQFENYLLNYGIIKSKSSSHDKVLIQEGYQVLRNQVNNLAKLRHPNVLTLIEPLEEHSKNFMFVTEYVTDCIESLYRNDHSRFSDGNSSDPFGDSGSSATTMDNILIQRGILQTVNALEFIHNRAGSVHLDLQPRSIFINENSDWKISGLGHLFKLNDNLQGGMSTDFFLPQYDPRIPSFMHINLDYSAPELVMDNTVSFKNDFFSLSLLIYFLYTGKNLLNTENSESQYRQEYAKFERKISSMSWDNVFAKVPQDLRVLIPKLMSRDMISRYDTLTDLLETDYFNNPLLKMLNFLDDLPTKNNDEKYVFLTGLSQYLSQFPASLLQKKFLPILLELLSQLCQEKIPDERCISNDLKLIVKIASNLSQLSFHEKLYHIIVGNKDNFKILLDTSNLVLIENIPIFKEKFKTSDFIDNFLKPLLNYVLQTMEGEAAVNAQEQVLAQLNIILEVFDFLTVKNYLLPLISKLFVKTTSLTIKNTCVSSFQLLIEKKTIDSYTCSEEVLPLFKTMKTRDPRILMKSLSLFQLIPTLIKDEVVLVEHLLPLIWNYSMSSTLTKSQYSEFTKAINKVSHDIQTVHITKLKDTNASLSDLSNNDNNKVFSKIIESQPQPKKEDPDSAFAKTIATPAIQPRKKEEKKSILDKREIPSRNEYSSMARTMKQREVPPTRAIPNRSSVTQAPPAPFHKQTANSAFDDEFDDFVSAVSSPKPTIAQNTNSSPALSPTPQTNNLPPGFSIALQPKKN